MTSIKLTRLIVGLALLFSPSSALAHARLLRSDPAAGSRIVSPQWIILWFSERPEITLSSAVLKDQSGKDFPVGPWKARADNPRAMTIPVVETLAPGTYTLAWRTAASDGHPSRGTFSFTVVAAPPVIGAAPPRASAGNLGQPEQPDTAPTLSSESTDDTDQAWSTISSLARAVSFAGILLVIGVTVFNILVVSRCPQIGSDLVGRMESRAGIVGTAASILVLLGAFGRLKLESMMMADMPDMKTMTMSDMAAHTRWGFALELQIIAASLALIAFAVGIKRVRGAWLLASICAAVLAFTPALAGHAAASPRSPSLMVINDFFHVVGASSWLGNLLCVMMIGVPIALRSERPEPWKPIAALVNAFSSVAIVSVTIVLLSGVIASWVHLDGLSALWTTDYGRVLLVKVALVLVTLLVGAYNFKRVQPQLIHREGSSRLRLSAAVELLIGGLVIIATGFLTGISP